MITIIKLSFNSISKQRKYALFSILGLTLSIAMIVLVTGFFNTLTELQTNILIQEYSLNAALDNTTDLSYAVKHNSSYIFTNSLSKLFSVFAVIYGISSISSVLSIRTGERTKTLAILSTIGANSIHKILYILFEVIILSVIVLPLGFVIGILLLFPLNAYFNSIIQSYTALPSLSLIGFQPITYCVIISFICFSTIIIAAFKASFRLLKKSPIEIARTYDAINISFKHNFIDKLIAKKFGVEGKLSVANYVNNKDKYKRLSFSVSASATFLVLFSLFQAYMMQLKTNQSNALLLNTFSNVFLYFIFIVLAISLFSTCSLFYINYAKRASEFAVLKSIGIEKNNLNKMIDIEAFYYGIYMLVFVVVGTTVGNALLFMILTEVNDTYTFIFPWKEVLISIGAISLVTICLSQFMTIYAKQINIVNELKQIY